VSRLVFLILSAAALVAGAAATAAPPAPQPNSSSVQALPPAAFTSGPVRPDARRLAELLMPEKLYLDAIERGVWAAVDQAGLEDPALAAAMRTELGKVTRADEQADMPATYDRYARAFASHFTPAEVTQLASFYGSRAGQKIIVGKLAGLDISTLLQKWSENPDAEIGAADIASLNRNAVSKVFGHLDKSDIAALLAFARTPVYAKLKAFGPTMNALEVQIATEPDPDFDAKMEAVTKDIMARFPAAEQTS
jgi:hypothetical protein